MKSLNILFFLYCSFLPCSSKSEFYKKLPEFFEHLSLRRNKLVLKSLEEIKADYNQSKSFVENFQRKNYVHKNVRAYDFHAIDGKIYGYLWDKQKKTVYRVVEVKGKISKV